jgi:hypothetical protein
VCDSKYFSYLTINLFQILICRNLQNPLLREDKRFVRPNLLTQIMKNSLIGLSVLSASVLSRSSSIVNSIDNTQLNFPVGRYKKIVQTKSIYK